MTENLDSSNAFGHLTDEMIDQMSNEDLLKALEELPQYEKDKIASLPEEQKDEHIRDAIKYQKMIVAQRIIACTPVEADNSISVIRPEEWFHVYGPNTLES